MSQYEEITQLEGQYLLPTYNRYPVAFERGKGAFLFDFEGNKYLDFVAGLGVNALGHSHPRIVKAVRDQVTKVVHLSNLYYNEYQGRLAEKLCQLSGLNRVFSQQWDRGDRRVDQASASRAIGREVMPESHGGARGLIPRPNFRCDVSHRAGQVSKGLRAITPKTCIRSSQ
jgi:hypothetical protein